MEECGLAHFYILNNYEEIYHFMEYLYIINIIYFSCGKINNKHVFIVESIEMYYCNKIIEILRDDTEGSLQLGLDNV